MHSMHDGCILAALLPSIRINLSSVPFAGPRQVRLRQEKHGSVSPRTFAGTWVYAHTLPLRILAVMHMSNTHTRVMQNLLLLFVDVQPKPYTITPIYLY